MKDDAASGAPGAAIDVSVRAARVEEGGAPSEAPVREFAFETLPFWRQVLGRGFFWNLVVGALTVALLGSAGRPGDTQLVVALVLVVVFVLGGLAIRFLRVRHGPPLSTVQFFREHLLAPARAGSDNVHRMEYGALLSLTSVGSGPSAQLCFGTEQHVARYFARDWREPASHEAFVAEVRQRLAALPDAAALLARLEQRNALALVAGRRTPRVTLALIGSLVVVFAWFWSSGAHGLFGLVRAGANARALVLEGQLYRLCSANFLHLGFMHLAVNCLSLWWLGGILERLIGHARFLLIYLLTALAGSLAAIAVPRAGVSVGASTAVFGLLGAFAVINFCYRHELPAGFRLSRSAWIGTLGLNTLLPLLVPQIDVAAHVGGLLGGALLAWPMCRLRPLDFNRPAGGRLVLGTAFVLGLFIASLTRAGLRSRDASSPDAFVMARAIAESARAPSGALNAVAWHYALQAQATPEELELAKRASERAVRLSPADANLTDTLATVDYRRKEYDAAIALERTLLRRDGPSSSFYSVQVARFLAARLRSSGPLEIGEGAQSAALQARLTAATTARPSLWVESARDYPAGAEVWLLRLAGNQLRGYCWLRLAPGSSAGEQQLALPDPIWRADQPEQALSVALLDTTSCAACERARAPHCAEADEVIRP